MGEAHAMHFSKWGKQGLGQVEAIIHRPFMPMKIEMLLKAQSVLAQLEEFDTVTCNVVFHHGRQGT
ncbi:hypothetical protein D3C77_801750 [compost metagenome]